MDVVVDDLFKGSSSSSSERLVVIDNLFVRISSRLDRLFV